MPGLVRRCRALSGKEPAPVYKECLAGNKGIVDQQQDGLCDLVTGSDASDGNSGRNACFDQRPGHFGVSQAWRDGIDGNTFQREAPRIASSQAFEASFGGIVGDAD